MAKELDRRQALRTSLGAAAVAGLAAAGTAATPGSAAALPAGAAAPVGPSLPDVPGMRGDRRANEFWYELDAMTLHGAPQGVADAYAEMNAYFGEFFEPAMRRVWFKTSGQPGYPRDFTAVVRPIAEPLRYLSRLQLDLIDRFYGRRPGELPLAFVYFGQGVLYDPRQPMEQYVHMMDGDPPVAYHNWHVALRAMMLLGIDRGRWREIAPLNALAWALQSVARPVANRVNPPLPARTVARLAAYWLPRDIAQLDRDFRSEPYPTYREA